MVSRKQRNGRRQCGIDGVHSNTPATAKLAEIMRTGTDCVRGERKRKPPYAYAWRRDQEGIEGRSARVYVRLREIEAVLEDTYGGKFLPDYDAGRDDFFIVAQHIRGFGGDVVQHVIAFAAMWMPWMPEAEAREMAERVIAHPQEWEADELARDLGVTGKRRERLGLTTIGASDLSPRKRKRLARKKHAAAKAAKRLAAGAKPHSESAERTRPWEAEDMSRRTWYRRKNGTEKGTDGTDSAEQGSKVLGRNSVTSSEPSRTAEGQK
jgi:hypothetical protein